MAWSNLSKIFFEDNFFMIEEAMEWENLEYDGGLWDMIDEYEKVVRELTLSKLEDYHDSIVPFVAVIEAIDSISSFNETIDDGRDAYVSWTLFRIISEISEYLNRGDFSKVLRVVDGERIEYVNRTE